MEQIRYIINHENLDILGISEANLQKCIPEYQYSIQDYDCFTMKTDYSRVIVYSKKSLKCKQIENITDESTACIWITAGKGRGQWRIGQYYREHSLLGQQGSNTWNNQVSRFDSFLNSLDKVADDKNCLIQGDFNINMNDECTDNNNNELKSKLLDTLPLAGFCQVVNKNTRFCKNQAPLMIDLAWINNLQKHVQTKN